jgi:hypothetical protein
MWMCVMAVAVCVNMKTVQINGHFVYAMIARPYSLETTVPILVDCNRRVNKVAGLEEQSFGQNSVSDQLCQLVDDGV